MGISDPVVLAEAAKLWGAWSDEEQNERSEVKYQEMMVEFKEGKTVQHNTAVSIFNDAQGTL